MEDASIIVNDLEQLIQAAYDSRHLRIDQYDAARSLVTKLEQCAASHSTKLFVDNIDEQINELKLRLRRMFGQEPSAHGLQQEYLWVLQQLGKLRMKTCFGC